MSDPYIGEIKMWAFSWAPRGWALCDGATLTVQQNQALAALLGKNFGGDGVNNFKLPDLRGRTPIGIGTTPGTTSAYATGNAGGSETVTLSTQTTPPHGHTVTAYNTPGTAGPPAGAFMSGIVSSTAGSTTDFSSYLPQANWAAQTQLAPASVSTVGSGTAHNNMQPFTVVNFTICTLGNFPPRN